MNTRLWIISWVVGAIGVVLNLIIVSWGVFLRNILNIAINILYFFSVHYNAPFCTVLQLGQLYSTYTLKKDLIFAFFTLPSLQEPGRNIFLYIFDDTIIDINTRAKSQVYKYIGE